MKKTRIIQITVALAVVALLSLTALILFLTKDGAPLIADFYGYTSKRTLNDSPLIETKLKRIQEGGRREWRFEYDHMYDSGVVMHQGKRTWGSDILTCRAKFTIEDGKHLKSCLNGKIDGGGEYIVAVFTDQGALSDIQAYAFIGETEFYPDIPNELLPYFVNYMGWKNYFDSMEPIDLRLKPYRLYETSSGEK